MTITFTRDEHGLIRRYAKRKAASYQPGGFCDSFAGFYPKHAKALLKSNRQQRRRFEGLLAKSANRTMVLTTWECQVITDELQIRLNDAVGDWKHDCDSKPSKEFDSWWRFMMRLIAKFGYSFPDYKTL